MTAVFLAFACLWPAAADTEAKTGLEYFRVRHGPDGTKKIAITMDDCNELEYVWKTVELCEQYGITMTFFPCGVNLHEEDRENWQKLLDAGCEIGSHSMWHVNLNTTERIKDGLNKFQEALDQTLGYHYATRWMRPPGGGGALEDKNGSERNAVTRIKQCGYDHALLWDVSYMKDAKGALEKTLAQTKTHGAILLFHARSADYKCLVDLIPMLLEAGLEPVTASELFGFDPPETSEELFVYDYKTYQYPRPDAR
jgi:peptidoglycan/xylan/chitin deacetylase (PgdA/CDA1 family)